MSEFAVGACLFVAVLAATGGFGFLLGEFRVRRFRKTGKLPWLWLGAYDTRCRLQDERNRAIDAEYADRRKNGNQDR